MSDIQQQEPQEKENHHQLLLVALFALSMIALLVMAILFIAPEIEKDLNQKITERLEKEGITASVSVSGRDVTLSGNVTDIKKAATATADVCGVHFIDNQLVASSVSRDMPDNDTELAHTLHPSPTMPAPQSKSVTPSTTEEKTAITPSPTMQSSSQAYDKILAAMSRYNEKQKSEYKEVRDSDTSSHKTPFDFDTSSIQFRKNSSILTSSSKTALKMLANKLKKSAKTIEIIVRSKKSKLAFEQAKKIQQYLIDQGVKKKTLIIIGTNSHTQDTTVTIVERKKSSP